MSSSTPPPSAPPWEPAPLPDALDCATWTLEQPRHLAAARRGARLQLAQSDAGPSAEAAEQVVMVLDELAANALRHGTPPARIELCRHAEGWLVVATDAAPGTLPVPTTDRPPEHGGMGLCMVARLTVRHGTDGDVHRKRVWALVAC